MKNLNQESKELIRNLSIETLERLLTFATTFKIQQFIIDRNALEYRDFEALVSTLGQNETIDGTGIIALKKEFSLATPNDIQDFLNDEVPLGAHELGAYIRAFPLSAAAASYVFTILEVYGNDVAEIVSKGGIRKNKAWHEDIKGFADLRDKVQVKKSQEAFAKHLGRQADKVTELAVHQIVNLKRLRNEFSHDAQEDVNFTRYLHDTLAVVCHIAFLTTDEDRFSVYPWEDHMETFLPKSKASGRNS